MSVVLTDRVGGGLLTVYELVALGRHPYTDWTGRLTESDHAAVELAIRAVGAEALAGRYLSELSDGERQKAMVARALAQEPDVMILDEITAFLDLPRRVEIMGILRRLAHEGGRTVLLSTHDLDLALHTADTIWLVREGTIVAGLPEELVLDGTFESAFQSDGVCFDRERGSFRIEHRGRGTVAVRGDSVTATWTRRALERRGYDIVAGAAADVLATIDVESHVVREGRHQRHASLRDMLDAL
jgi:iron complex transport system ATP-binding protein